MNLSGIETIISQLLSMLPAVSGGGSLLSTTVCQQLQAAGSYSSAMEIS